MYPPVAFPPTSNTLSSHERSALVRSSRKLFKVLGDVPRAFDDIPLPSEPIETESTWHKRKPTHLPSLFKRTLDSHGSESPLYHRPPSRCGSVLSVSPSIVSNAPSTASSDSAQRRTKLERVRRKLGHDVPATAVFPTSPTTAAPRTPRASTSSKKASRGRTRPVVRPADDARSIAFSINSDESVHAVTFTTRVRTGSPHPHKTKHVYHTGALPPVPPIPAHLCGNGDDDDVGLLRPRPKMAAGSMIGGADFKAARRAKREGNGVAEPGELVEMVGFLF